MGACIVWRGAWGVGKGVVGLGNVPAKVRVRRVGYNGDYTYKYIYINYEYYKYHINIIVLQLKRTMEDLINAKILYL